MSEPTLQQRTSLVDLLDRLLGAGVVLEGDLVLSVAGVDLVYVGLRLVLSSMDTLERALAEGAP